MLIDIAEICKALYCLCRFYSFKNEGVKRGRELEDAFLDYCISQKIQPERSRGLTLFGFNSWSGVRHEVDNAIKVGDIGVDFEFKAYQQEVLKDQIMVFNEKSIDHFFSILTHGAKLYLYRIFASDSDLDDNAKRLCYMWSIIHIEPGIVPIPTILTYFRDPVWEDRVPWVLVSEAERILPKFVQPLNSSIKLIQKNTYALSIPDPHEIDEVLDAHVNMSSELLDTIESYEPDHFEKYATEIIAKMGAFDHS